MTTLRKATTYPLKTAATPAQAPRIHSRASKAGRFILHLLEMLLAMEVGMAILHLLGNLIPASSSYTAAFESGTNLHTLAMAVFMIVPMVAWMIVRGHGWRHVAEMAFAMLAPMAAVALLCQLGLAAYLPWLAFASSPAMYLGMLTAMLYRRDHYTVKAGHSAHIA